LAAYLGTVRDVAIAPDGTLYANGSDYTGSALLWKMTRNGRAQIIAQADPSQSTADGIPASQARVSPSYLATGPDGSLYYSDRIANKIRRISPDGIVTTVIGNGNGGCGADPGYGGPATKGCVDEPEGLAIAPDGALYFATRGPLEKVALALPGFSDSDITIPSEDGSQLYRFDKNGKQLATMNTTTGATTYSFAYDTAGRLVSVTDGDGNVTHINHDANGQPTTIVGPYGQQTTLTTGADGYLSSIKDPGADETDLTYHGTTGLLASLTDPNGHASTFTFDDLGRLTNDADAAGGSKTLTRTGDNLNYDVSVATALGRTENHQIEHLANGDLRTTNTAPDGSTTQLTAGTDGGRSFTSSDGTTVNGQLGPDPRFGMQSPILKSATLTTPGGLSYSTQAGMQTTLATPGDPLTLTGFNATSSINGNDWTTSFDHSSSTFTTTSPVGRTTTTDVDQQERPLSEQIGGITPVSYTYDSHGRVATAVQGLLLGPGIVRTHLIASCHAIPAAELNLSHRTRTPSSAGARDIHSHGSLITMAGPYGTSIGLITAILLTTLTLTSTNMIPPVAAGAPSRYRHSVKR
jgi:YD repeat-containing protein